MNCAQQETISVARNGLIGNLLLIAIFFSLATGIGYAQPYSNPSEPQRNSPLLVITNQGPSGPPVLSGAKAYIGQFIQLYCAASQGGITITNVTWSVQGTKFWAYEPTQAKAQVESFASQWVVANNPDADPQLCQFFWVTPGTYTATFTATVNGKPNQHDAVTFIVVGPKVQDTTALVHAVGVQQLADTGGTVYVMRPLPTYDNLGQPIVGGFSFRARVFGIDSLRTAQTCFCQIISPNEYGHFYGRISGDSYYYNPTTAGCDRSEGDTANWQTADNGHNLTESMTPYSSTSVTVRYDDTPDAPSRPDLKNVGPYPAHLVTRSDVFQNYLMWNCGPGAFWVPIWEMDWGWNGTMVAIEHPFWGRSGYKLRSGSAANSQSGHAPGSTPPTWKSAMDIWSPWLPYTPAQ